MPKKKTTPEVKFGTALLYMARAVISGNIRVHRFNVTPQKLNEEATIVVQFTPTKEATLSKFSAMLSNVAPGTAKEVQVDKTTGRVVGEPPQEKQDPESSS